MKNVITKIISIVKKVVKTIVNFIRGLFTKETEETIVSVEEPQIQKSSESRIVSDSSNRSGLVGRTFKCKKGNKGHQWTDEEKEMQSLKQNGLEHKNYGRAVLQCDIESCEVIHTFKSVATAARSTKIAYSAIHNCCNNKLYTAGGYIFVYA